MAERKKKTKKRKDKIFNNGYKSGEGMRNESYEYQSSISVSASYADAYLKDVYEYEDTLDYNIGVDKIFKLIDNDKDLRSLLKKIDNNQKLKLSKEEINWCFNRILAKMDEVLEGETFYNPIYVLEVMSSILNVNTSDPIKNYKKIFDCLDVDIQSELITELNKKFDFLDGKKNKRSMH
jgi:hypothetical protein